MPFAWATGDYNVQSSFNKFFKDNINGSLPSWASSIAINYNYPDFPLFDEDVGDYAPKFSVTHLGAFDESISEGQILDAGKRGQRRHLITEVSAWVNGKSGINTTNENWPRDLMQMGDMVRKLFSGTRTLPIVDIYTSATNPSNTGYVMRIDKVEEVEFAPDPNPNIKRRRFLIHAFYEQRQ
jgi:hypothetical protein